MAELSETGLKEEQILAFGRMGSDGAVAAHHLHIADLTLAEILEDTVRSIAIRVTVLATGLAGDKDHEREISGGDNAALWLAAEALVNVSTPIVCPLSLKAPHVRPRVLRGVLGECDAGGGPARQDGGEPVLHT